MCDTQGLGAVNVKNRSKAFRTKLNPDITKPRHNHATSERIGLRRDEAASPPRGIPKELRREWNMSELQLKQGGKRKVRQKQENKYITAPSRILLPFHPSTSRSSDENDDVLASTGRRRKGGDCFGW